MMALSHHCFSHHWESDLRQNLKQERWITHYSSSQRILLVGEGDFSFSSALASAFGLAKNITATSLDSLEEVLTKYRWAGATLTNLSQRGAKVLHNVDVKTMVRHVVLSTVRFDVIVWNMPHAGFFRRGESHESVIKKHKILLESFFFNASKILVDDGEVHVSHHSSGPYEKWDIENLAQSCGLQLKECVPFLPSSYPGYRNRRGVGKFASESFSLQMTKTYKFVRRRLVLNPLNSVVSPITSSGAAVPSLPYLLAQVHDLETAEICKRSPATNKHKKRRKRKSEALNIPEIETRENTKLVGINRKQLIEPGILPLAISLSGAAVPSLACLLAQENPPLMQLPQRVQWPQETDPYMFYLKNGEREFSSMINVVQPPQTTWMSHYPFILS